jgi:hypothetical protein
VGEAEHLGARGQRDEAGEEPIAAERPDEVHEARPHGLARRPCRAAGGRRPGEHEATREEAGRDREVPRAGAQARGEGAGQERAGEPPDPHRDAEEGDRVDQLAGAHQVVGVALAGRLVEGADAARGDREDQDVPDGHDAGKREPAQHGAGRAHPVAGQPQQADAVTSVGDDAGREADDEHGRHPQPQGEAHHERRVGQLERQPAEHHLLAHHADRFEEGAEGQEPDVAPPQQRHRREGGHAASRTSAHATGPPSASPAGLG